jgi:hypothetical protein
MMCSFEIKSSQDLVWADIPYIGNPIFVVGMVMECLQMRDSVWGRITNIDSFHKEAVPHYSALNNHYVVRDEVDQLFRSGRYYGVSRTQRPTSALYNWRELAGHPEGGEWHTGSVFYIDMSKRLLQRLDAKRRQQARLAAEEVAIAEELVAAARSVRSRAEKPASAPVISQPTPDLKPRSLNDCEQRLAAARERLIAEGYKPKYTDEELMAIAQKGELDDRFVVRLTETKYAGNDGYLGQMNNGEVKYWSTTFNQMENADTDPKTLCALIGVDYKPEKSYTLVIVDTQAAGTGQSVTIVPTHKNLGNFAKSEIKGINPEAVDKVMTPEYNGEYAEHMVAFKASGGHVGKEKHMKDYANANFSNKEDKVLFKTRMKINEKLGANEYYTGDGTTKNLIADCPNKCGVMETFTYDKSPQTLAQLEANDSAKRFVTTPI